MSAKARILDKLRHSLAGTETLPDDFDETLVTEPWRYPPEQRLARLRELMEAVRTEIHLTSQTQWPDLLAALLAEKQLTRLLIAPETDHGRQLTAHWSTRSDASLSTLSLSLSPQGRGDRIDGPVLSPLSLEGRGAGGEGETAAGSGTDSTQEHSPSDLPALHAYDRPVEEWKHELFHDTPASLTGTVGAIAATGSLILCPDRHEPRLMSLVPPVHFALLRASTIHDNLYEAQRALNWRAGMPTNALLISGPSKTADIEQVLAYGAHGPKDLVVLILEDA
ncbi:hypothetical protein B5T_02576 [Alloalcanivorax dieselolei B5]|uniref:LUD domain-containing protein n=1 Tax=Alcanivorax dieselolei (strain DSM 16502 / CGMCC 1.3690 / MCCC 1A00001 / B-5) TaxID=930169 RepID=K0CE15_ALCDB|nr:lactate utilization protein [Alloalcanivorax dieselolei]AFT70848.1 hypothetical protein B5T_02576 [Alloalcanivorax dieselolei B5]GGJ98245.1 hypothetical protein GCM10007426_29160 [Alloalcanivorax dieselolei]